MVNYQDSRILLQPQWENSKLSRNRIGRSNSTKDTRKRDHGRKGQSPTIHADPRVCQCHHICRLYIGNWDQNLQVIKIKLPETFYSESKEINLFNKKLLEISKKSRWIKTGSNILVLDDANGNTRNLIAEYGRLTIEDTKNHDMAYIGQHTRQYQNSIQMYHRISNSITKAKYLKIMVEMYKYTVQVTPVVELLFKLMMQK